MSLGNTAQRVIVAFISIPLILALCYLGNLYFFLFAAMVGLVSFYEFYSLAKNRGINGNLPLGLITIFLILVNNYHHFVSLYTLFLVRIIILTLYDLFRNNGSAINNIGTTLFGVMYIGMLSGALISIREIYPAESDFYARGGYIIIAMLASIWLCDSAAFFIGVRFGKHKLFPRVSPKKSWEGAIAGFVFSVLTMIAAKFLVLGFLSWTTIIAFGIIVGITGQLGDLIESLIKRDAGVKDSSTLIPGHGGIFDRFDSLLYISPVIYIYLEYVVL
ncbi:MAG: phosphatidate cytidylyltransferase [Ignavibacteriaceae bacterium]|nr:phosphatidate cytidylyltransferase [Ignavibacteriaceae bacterium]